MYQSKPHADSSSPYQTYPPSLERSHPRRLRLYEGIVSSFFFPNCQILSHYSSTKELLTCKGCERILRLLLDVAVQRAGLTAALVDQTRLLAHALCRGMRAAALAVTLVATGLGKELLKLLLRHVEALRLFEVLLFGDVWWRWGYRSA